MSHLFSFMLPFLLANILNSVYNLADSVIIGQFAGSAGIVAVSLGGKTLKLFTDLATAFSAGGQVLLAQVVGAKKREELSGTIGTMFSELLLLSLVFSVLTLVFSRKILIWMNTPEDIFADALAYMRITSLGLPLLFAYTVISAALRGMGDSRHPLVFIAVACVCNLVWDVVLVVFLRLGVRGTAIATVAAQGISVLFSVRVLYQRRDQFGFDFRPRSFRIRPDKLKTMLKIGWPLSLRSLLITLTQMVMLRYINLLGIAAAAAYNIGDRFYQLANVISNSVRHAAAAMMGQNIGADKPERVRSIFRCSMACTFGAAAVLVAVSLAFPEAIFRCFTADADTIAFARGILAITSLIYLLSALVSPYEAVITATGFTALSFCGGFLDSVVFRLGFSFLFVFGWNWGIYGYSMGNALARLGLLIPGAIYYHSGAWRRRKKLVK